MTFQTFTPIQYLMIDIANSFGLDKEDWGARLDWFAQNQAEIEGLSRLDDARAIKSHPLIVSAESPAKLFAGVKAWACAKRGEPIGYAVSLDATASGAQLLTALIGCEKSARHCNLIDTGHREDLYTNGYLGMLSRMSQAPATGAVMAPVTRAQAKAAIMPLI